MSTLLSPGQNTSDTSLTECACVTTENSSSYISGASCRRLLTAFANIFSSCCSGCSCKCSCCSIMSSMSVVFCSSSISALMAFTSALLRSGVSSSLTASGRFSINDSFAYPNAAYCSWIRSEYPSSENLSLIAIKRDTWDLSRLYSPAANATTLVYPLSYRILVSLATFSAYPIRTKPFATRFISASSSALNSL